jgi:hypothetical protein
MFATLAYTQTHSMHTYKTHKERDVCVCICLTDCFSFKARCRSICFCFVAFSKICRTFHTHTNTHTHTFNSCCEKIESILDSDISTVVFGTVFKCCSHQPDCTQILHNLHIFLQQMHIFSNIILAYVPQISSAHLPP